jgi:hypothetical protein
MNSWFGEAALSSVGAAVLSGASASGAPASVQMTP